MWIEAVPNFSEGRDPKAMAAIAGAAARAGAAVLDIHQDPDHHRSVVTLAGDAMQVVEALVQTALEAVARIDLRRHQGVHPRIGAVDVIPLVPLGQARLGDCVELAVGLGRRLGQLGLPVYLYGEAATRPERRRLAAIRRGQFEGLAAAMALPWGAPDFGPSQPHPTAGAVAVGARGPLIAFNVDLAPGADVGVARAVARAVRASSGGLPAVQALGWWLARRGRAQVSMNLLDYRVTGLAAALAAVRAEAARHGATVAQAEIVGLAPEAALTADFVQDPAFRQSPQAVALEVKLRQAGIFATVRPG
jgi:glutamate formiminotransferase